MKKCILIFSLIFSMLASSVTWVYAESGTEVGTAHDATAVNFSIQLGLFSPNENGEIVLNQTVNRAALAKILSKMIHAESMPEAKLSITDMDREDPMYGDVAAAIHAGLSQIPESRLFHPNDPAYAYQLVSSMLDILGYRPIIADQKDWSVAQKLGLLDGLVIRETDALNYAQAAKICYNAMDIPMVIQDRYGKEPKYRVDDSAKIYTEYWKATYATGVVDGNEITALTAESSLKEGWISIDQKPYRPGETHADSLLGMAVEYWYTEDDTLVYLQKLEDNRVLTCNAEDITKTERSQIWYYPDDAKREKTAKLSKTADVIYNGRALFAYTEADLKPQSGFVEMIDNNHDGLYEVVKVYEYINRYIVNLDTEAQTVTDGIRAETMDLNPNDRSDIFFKTMQTESEALYTSSFDQLMKKSILSVMESKDGECITVIESRNRVSGTVTSLREKDGRTIVGMGEGEYTISSDYIALLNSGNQEVIDIKAGVALTLYLDFHGEVAFASNELSEWRYGLLTGAAVEGVFRKALSLRLLSDEGLWEDRQAADTLTFCDAVYKNAALVYDQLREGGTTKVQIVKYKLRPDGKIANLEIAVDRYADTSYIGYDTSCFTHDASLTNVKYKIRDRSFSHKYSIELTTTTMYYLPSSAIDASGRVIEDEILFIGGNYFINDRSYSLDIYDSDEYFVPRAVVVTASTAENYETDILYVNDKIALLNQENEETYLIEGIQGNTAVSYLCDKKEVADSVEVGDALKISLNNSGRIRRLARITSFSGKNTDGTLIRINENQEKNPTDEFGFYTATVWDVDYARSAILAYTTNANDLKKFSGSYMKILVYNAEKNRFEVGDISRIHGVKHSQTPSRVLIHDRYLETRSLVVIENL